MAMIDRALAREILQRCEVPIGANFYTLDAHRVCLLVAEGKRLRYRHPKNANGSYGRYFHAYMQRRAQGRDA
jgi:hypothetical protein